MADVIVLGIVAVIILAAGSYIYQAKKKGVKCIGCPMGGNCHGCTGCSGEDFYGR